MQVKNLMSTDIYFVKEQASASDAIQLMKQYNVGFVPVCSEIGELLGVVTDRDILLRAAASPCMSPEQISIKTIMTTETITLSAEMEVHKAALLFSKHGLHRLPVVDGTRLIGILSITDLARKKVYLAEVGDILWSIASKG